MNKILLFVFNLMLLTSCRQNAGIKMQAPYTLLQKNSTLLKNNPDQDSAVTYAYCHVLISLPAKSRQLLHEKINNYIKDSLRSVATIAKDADTINITFWAHNNRTSYFIHNAQESTGGLEDHMLMDDFEDLLGNAICIKRAEDSARLCYTFLYRNAQNIAVDTFEVKGLSGQKH